MKKYNCDICDVEYSRDKSYFGYNTTFGYCDKLECKKEADEKISEALWDCAGRGDFDGFEELVGDGDVFDFI